MAPRTPLPSCLLRALKRSALLLIVPIAAHAQGDSQAPEQMPKLITHGSKSKPKTPKQLEEDAAAGQPTAQYELAHDLETGSAGFQKDFDRALRLYAQAGANGDTDGYFRLGMIYDDGLGVDKDSPKALEYFKAAGSAGDKEAQYNVGTILVGAHGGVKRDWVEGLAWLILAHKNGASGDGEAQVRKHLASHPELIASAEQRALKIQNEKVKVEPPSESIQAPQPIKPEIPAPKLDVPPTHVMPPGPQ